MIFKFTILPAGCSTHTFDEVICFPILVDLPMLGDFPLNGKNLNKGRHEASRHFRNKTRGYLKDGINELATHTKNNNITDK
jgi:hypothetical protein